MKCKRISSGRCGAYIPHRPVLLILRLNTSLGLTREGMSATCGFSLYKIPNSRDTWYGYVMSIYVLHLAVCVLTRHTHAHPCTHKHTNIYICVYTYVYVCWKLYYESPSSLDAPPPTCKAYPIAILMHGHYAIYTPQLPPPPVYAIHHTILVMAISCKDQLWLWGRFDEEMCTSERHLPTPGQGGHSP